MIAVTITVRATMNSNSTPSQPSALRVSVAYLLAVTTATTCIVVSQFPHVIAQRASGGLLYPLARTLLVLLSDSLFIIVLWLPALLFSALPCVLLHLFASRFQIRSLLFYIPMGCVLALLAVAPMVSATSGWTWYTDPSSSLPPVGFWQTVHSIAPVFTVAGAIAGLSFWIAAGRHFHRGRPNIT
jgi:hypothetical protein